MKRLTEYNYKVHHWPDKANMMQIANGMSCLPTKYSQYTTEVDLEKMVLTVTPFQSWLFILFIQSSAIPELSHWAYRQSNWYRKIISFLLDGPSALENLSLTVKKAVKQAITKYQVTDKHLFYIKRGKETGKCLFLYKKASILKWTHNEHGHFANYFTLHKVRGR